MGCDIGMDEVMAERRNLLYLLAAGTIILTSVILTAAVLFINRAVVKPLHTMTEEMKKFTPSEKLSYKEAGVMDIDIRSNDEIGEIYEGIRNLEINTIDYLHDMAVLQEENRKAENDLRDKEEQIDQLSIESSTDALTGVGNKTAYIRKTDELNTQMNDPSLEFAMVMVDMNNLKQINDEHGHRAGDLYIQGCCRMVCETFKHSPVYRIGGDEFVAILQGTDYKGRKAACERLRAAFEKSCGQKDASPWLRYSAAVGMAERAADDNTAEFVFRRADKAMYLDKERFKKEHGIETR
ncbi:MAG: GGDEF domain-containing protein [Oscillospiraceae bacterium]|nr:GGDEF domain-containing protein [Oscillospiraceae bacterium]